GSDERAVGRDGEVLGVLAEVDDLPERPDAAPARQERAACDDAGARRRRGVRLRVTLLGRGSAARAGKSENGRKEPLHGAFLPPTSGEGSDVRRLEAEVVDRRPRPVVVEITLQVVHQRRAGTDEPA